MAVTWCALAVAPACAARSDHHEHPEDEAYHTFFEVANRGTYVDDQRLATTAELAAFCEAIVVGRIVSARPSGIALGFNTSLLEIKVERTLKGASDESVYVELWHSVSAREIQETTLPTGRGLWLLQRASETASSPLDQDRGEGLPAGEQLWGLASRQGLVYETADGLTQPFLPDEPAAWLEEVSVYTTIESLADCDECIR